MRKLLSILACLTLVAGLGCSQSGGDTNAKGPAMTPQTSVQDKNTRGGNVSAGVMTGPPLAKPQ